MGRKDGAEARKDRIAKMLKQIMAELYKAKQQGLDHISLKQTKVCFQIDLGLTKERIDEYLTLMQEANKIELDSEKDQIRFVM